MKILLVGGGGFIGVWLTKALVEAGHRVRIVGRSRLPDEKWSFLPGSGWEFWRGTFQELVAGYRFLADADVIVPLAWLLGSVASDEDPMGSLGSATDMLALFQVLVKFNLKPLIVFPSSHLAPKPRCLYALHKVLTEGHLDYYWRVHGIPYVALRTAKAYGPLQRRGVIWSYLKWALAGDSLPVYGEGRDRIALIYVQDAARGLKWAIEGKFPPNRIYNLVGCNATMVQIAKTVIGSVRRNVFFLPEVQHIPWPPKAKVMDSGDLPLGNNLCRWGWEPEIGLKTGIDRTMEWVRGILA